MKRLFTICTLILLGSSLLKAQIPNNGFESWDSVGAYEEPSGVWQTPNSFCAGPFYPITKSTDHYPANVGNYSVKIESDTSNPSGMGVILTNPVSIMGGPMPSFPISGHPTSFCGYYKFFPQNNDTMVIFCQLSLNGTNITWAQITLSDSVTDWTSFNIPFNLYGSADSASLVIAAYQAGPTGVPHGNSVLYVDNLSFDSLITTLPKHNEIASNFELYPNPANDIITFDIDGINDFLVNIYNNAGQIVKSQILTGDQRKINIMDLKSGIYIMEINSGDLKMNKEFIISRD